MGIPTLVIGNKNYSSWSLRAWLILAKLDIEFEEVRIPLNSGYQEQLLRYSPTAKVPVYLEDDLVIWDSLAIAEYFAEQHPTLLPSESKPRAKMRSLAAEMHSGFMSLRSRPRQLLFVGNQQDRIVSQMPMNCRASDRQVGMTSGLAADIKRVQTIWTDCRKDARSGSWLFGDFSIVDAMYAPVVFRFNTYDVECNSLGTEYMNMVLNDPDLQRWYEAAKHETEVIQEEEVGIN